LRRALEERLEGSSEDFRGMRNRVREVGILLFILGLLTLVLGGFIFVSSPETTDPVQLGSERIALAFNGLVCVAMLVAARLVDRHPQKTILAVFIGWLLLQIVVAVFFPLALFTGLFGKFLALVILGRGFVSARAADKFRKGLVAQALKAGAG